MQTWHRHRVTALWAVRPHGLPNAPADPRAHHDRSAPADHGHCDPAHLCAEGRPRPTRTSAPPPTRHGPQPTDMGCGPCHPRSCQGRPRPPQHLQHLCAPVEGRPGGGGHARCQTHLIQRTALLHQPLGRGIVAAIEGCDQRIEACALLHISDIVTVLQAQFQPSDIAFFSGLEQFHAHLSTSIS